MANKVTKTLITKFNTDVTLMNDAQIEALKAFYQISYKAAGLEIGFELLIDDEEERSLDLYQHIQKEFKLSESTPPATSKPTTQTQKKPSNPFAGLSKLFGELGELLEDGEEGE